jgi:cell shape-determining protein MreC
MSRRRSTAPARRKHLVVLIGLSIIGFFLPTAWTGRLTNVLQLLVPFQVGTTVVLNGLSPDSAHAGGQPVPRDEFADLLREKQSLEHMAAALASRIADLEHDVEILTATRLWDAGTRIGDQGKLIPARVIIDDMLSWRSSRLLSAGSTHGVRTGAPVVSRHFTVQPAAEGVESGMAVLLGEALVGIVDQVSTHNARAKLLSDVSVQMKVRLGRFDETGFAPLEREFWLTGRGNNVMEIGDAEWKDISEGRIEIGDIVVSDPDSSVLPATMTIGRVESIVQNARNPLLAILRIKPALDTADLRRVYVFHPAASTKP